MIAKARYSGLRFNDNEDERAVVARVLRGLLARGAAPTDIAVLSPYNAQMDLDLGDKRLTSVPAWIEQLTSLEVLSLSRNQLTSVPAAIRELSAAGCRVNLDRGVTVDE